MKSTDIVGKRVSQVRPATLREMEKCGWKGLEPPVVYVLENGYVFLPATDCEINAPGQMLILDVLSGEVSAFSGGDQSCWVSSQPNN
jgi:hypothetical protein